MRKGAARVRRVDVTDEMRSLTPAPAPDYVDAFELTPLDAAGRSPERWARDSLERMPRPLGWLVLFGWRFVLGLKLGPRPSADHVLGWRRVRASPATALLEARSFLMTAHLLFRVEGTTFTWMTFVHHGNRASRVVWVPVGLLHRRIVPYVIARAASHPIA